MDDDIVKQFRRLFLPPVRGEETSWHPAVDVYRTPRGWAVKIDAAGVSLQDISWRIEGNRLAVSGVRRDAVVGRGWTVYRMEIAYATFQRVVELPCDISAARVWVEQDQGMVLLILECEPEAEER